MLVGQFEPHRENSCEDGGDFSVATDGNVRGVGVVWGTAFEIGKWKIRRRDVVAVSC